VQAMNGQVITLSRIRIRFTVESLFQNLLMLEKLVKAENPGPMKTTTWST
jgi:hypothetical protein